MNAAVVEKDFWVCWTLRRLFAMPDAPACMVFKGGTSLSKVFNATDRFSEDVDISFDRADLGFGGERDPGHAPSKKQAKNRLKLLKEACQAVVRDRFIPKFTDIVGDALRDSAGGDWSIEADADDPDCQTVLFHYPLSSAANAAVSRHVHSACRAFGNWREIRPLAGRTGSHHTVCRGTIPRAVPECPEYGSGAGCGADILGEGNHPPCLVSRPPR